MRIGGVSVGKVKSVELAPIDEQIDGQDTTEARDRDRPRVRADLERRAGDPAPEDAARRDLRRADLGHRARRQPARRSRSAPRPTTPTRETERRRVDPRGRLARPRPGPGPDPDRRDLQRARRGDPDRLPAVAAGRRGRDPAAAASTSTTRSATSARSSATPPTCSPSCAARRPSCRASSATPAPSSTRSASATASSPTRSPARTRPSTRSPPRTQSLRDFFQVAPTFENETAADPQPPRRVPGRTPGRWSRSCCRSPTTSARPCAASASSRRNLKLALLRPRRPRPRLASAGFPALARFLRGLRPMLDNLDPFLANLNPVVSWLNYYRTNITDFLSNPPAGLSGHADAAARPAGGPPRAEAARLHHPGVAGDLPEPPAGEPRQRLPACRTTT